MLNWIERNDARVVRRVLAGQREEFGQLVEKYLGAVQATAMARLGDFAEAEDVAQEAFVKAMTSLDQLRDHSKFGAWLLTITRNLCCRVYARREYDARAAEQVKPAPADSLAPVEQRELRELLHAQMASLSEEHREVLLLHYFAGMKLRDIARHLELKRDAVAKRLQRAREALGDRMLRHVKDSRFQPSRNKTRAVVGAALAAPVAWKTASAATVATAAGGTATGAASIAAVLLSKPLLVGLAATALVTAGTYWTSQRDVMGTETGAVATVERANHGTDSTEQAPGAPASTEPPVSSENTPASASSSDDIGITAGEGNQAYGPANSIENKQTMPVADKALAGGIVSGRVTDADTGRPIPGIDVYASGEDLRVLQRTSTDDGGRYRLTGLPIASLRIHPGRAKGYPSPDRHDQKVVQTKMAEEIANVDFAPSKGERIKGLVRYADGSEAARVAVEAAVPPGSQYEWTETRQEGAFEINGFRNGQAVYLRAKSDTMVSPLFGPVIIGNPEAHKIVLVLSLERNREVEGVVLDGQGRPVQGAGVRLDGNGPVLQPISPIVVTDANGRFVFTDIMPGEYSVFIGAGESTYQASVQGLAVSIGKKDVTGLRIVYADDLFGMSISGIVIDTEGLPIESAFVTANGIGIESHGEIHSGKEGAFTINTLNQGPHVVGAAHPDYTAAQLLDIAAGSQNLKLVLGPKSTLQGQVVDAGTKDAITDFTIGYSVERKHGTRTVPDAAAIHDTEGRFSLDMAHAGDVTLEIDAAGFLPGCVTIPGVEAGASIRDILVRLQPGCVIEGRVLTEEGLPIAGVLIYERQLPARQHERESESIGATDSKGMFRLDSVPPGEKRLVFWQPGFVPTSTNALAGASASHPIEVRMLRGGLVKGQVLIPTGYRVDMRIAFTLDERLTSIDCSNFGSDGTFAFNTIPTGVCALSASASPAESSSAYSFFVSRKIDVLAAEPLNETLEFHMGITSLEGSIIADDPAWKTSQLMFESPEWHGLRARTHVDRESSTYHIESLPPGHAQVTIWGQLGGIRRTFKDTVDIPRSGAYRYTPKITFSNGSLCVAVHKRDPLQTYHVAVHEGIHPIPQAESPSYSPGFGAPPYALGALPETGVLEIPHVAPGTYTLLVTSIRDDEQTSFENRTIEISEDQTTRVELGF